MMRLAYTMTGSERGGVDLLLCDFATALAARGVRACGVVQVNTLRPGARVCDMDVRVLPDGPVHRISQSLGAGARGCRLDPAALEAAVADVEHRFARGCDVLIVNKFGKHEAEGRGFRALIAEALCADAPVIVGTNALNRAAFETFSGGAAEALAPDLPTLLRWWDRVAVPGPRTPRASSRVGPGLRADCGGGEGGEVPGRATERALDPVGDPRVAAV